MALLLVGQTERLEHRVPLAPAVVEEIDDLVERREDAVVHIWSGLGDIEQCRRAEGLPVLFILRDKVPARVLRQRPVFIEVIELGNETARHGDLGIGLVSRVLGHVQSMEPVVREADPEVAFSALPLLHEQDQPLLRALGERLLVPVQMPVERAVPREQRAFERRDGHGHPLPGRLAVEDFLERIDIFRNRPDHLLDEIDVPVHFEGGHHREKRLVFEGQDPSVMEQELLEGHVHKRRRVPPVARRGITERDVEPVRKGVVRVMAGCAAHGPVPGKPPVEEELLPELDLFRGLRVLLRRRNGGKGNERSGEGGSPAKTIDSTGPRKRLTQRMITVRLRTAP